MDGRGRQPLVLLLGIGLLLLASLVGRQDVLSAVLEPPLLVRPLFGAAAVLVGAVLAWRATERFGSASSDPRALIRGVRLMFLALAALAAAAGWFLGSALPVVVALVIAGVDVIETTTLLMVVRSRGDDEGS